VSDGAGPSPARPSAPPLWFWAAILLAATIAAVLFILRSGGESEDAIPSPAATASPLPTPTSELTPAPGPTTPTSSPPPEAAALGASCSYDHGGYGIDYPAGWFTPVDPDWVCQLFDPEPIAVERYTELPIVAVTVYVDSHHLGRVRAFLADPSFYEVVSEETGTFSDASRPGTILETRQTEELLWPAGTLTYSVLVNRLDATIVVTTNDLAAGDYALNKQIALAMAHSLRIGG